MNQYEVTFIVDPVLSGDEIKSTAQTYRQHLENEGCKIVHVDEMGLRQLAYPINKRNSGVYYCIEFQNEVGSLIPRLELAFSRDERIMRFLSVKLDKYGIKYNEDKRNGLIGKAKAPSKKADKKTDKRADRSSAKAKSSEPAKTAPVKAAPVKAAPVKEAAPAASSEEE